MNARGIVYLTGAGPGDPKLLTLRALEVLRSAEAVVHDHLANDAFLNEAPEDCERIYVGKQAGAHSMPQDEINALLVKLCKNGKRVVRLKGGDPYVFGRGGEEALELARANCAFEVIPGISSGIAGPACAGIPVTHRGLSSSVTFITGHEDPTKDSSDLNWDALASMPGTLVFYMGVRNLPAISKELMTRGKDAGTPCAVVQHATWPGQRTVTAPLSEISEVANAAGITPPAIVVVGAVASLRDEIAWFETRPLFGQRVMVTRSRAQASVLKERLIALGAQTVSFPVIRIAPPEDRAPLLTAAAQAGAFDWIIFTSVNGVDAFFEAMVEMKKDTRSLHECKVCAIGPATAARCAENGVQPDLVPEKYVAESVLEALRKADNLQDRAVLIPRSAIAREFLPDALREDGATVEVVTAYQTLSEKPTNIDTVRADLAAGSIGVVTFTSSSTVRNWVDLVGHETVRSLSESVQLVSIGPETTRTLREFTDRPVVQAEIYTIDGVIDAVLDNRPPRNKK